VHGRVQGVGFRAFVVENAHRLGLVGWVRNVGWNQVEAVAEGERSLLDQWIQAAGTGPRGSRVEDVRVEWEEPTGEFTCFEVTFTH